MKLIDKDALVAEIKARISDIEVSQKAGLIKKRDADKKIILFKSVLSFLNTLNTKEVDLEKELKEDWLFADKIEVDCLESMCLTEGMFVSLAKKYFELGLKAREE